MHESFLNIFVGIKNLTIEKVIEIAKKLEVRTYKKNEIILKAGEIENNLYFITKGLVRMYINDEKGEEKCYRFFLRDKFFTVLPSFVDEVPSVYCTQAIEETEVIVIPKEQLLLFYETYPFIEKIVREHTERYLIEMSNHLYSLHVHSTTKRYYNFIENNKELARVLPLKYISTYLGIHPNSLSRIRRAAKNNE